MRRNSSSAMKKTPKKDISDPNTRAELIEVLMKDPVKRAMVLELINTEKEAIEEYKKRERLKQIQSPADKLKVKHTLESPTSLMRRRALLEMEKVGTGSPSSSSSKGTLTALKGTPGRTVPFKRILEKVIVFVEVLSDGENRSEGIKELLKNMGAKVVDKITRETTHVLFKDGSYLTYQKAKLMKTHLVSVLWLDTCYTTGFHANECDYPALGKSNPDVDMDQICDKLQNVSTAVLESLKQSQQKKIAQLSQLEEINKQSPLASQDVIPDSQDLVGRRISYSRKSRLFSKESSVDSDCGVNALCTPLKNHLHRHQNKGVGIQHGNASSDDIVVSSSDEFMNKTTKSKQNKEDDKEVTLINKRNNEEDNSASSNEYTNSNITISPKKKRRTLFNLETYEKSFDAANEEHKNSRKSLIANVGLNQTPTPKKQRTLHKGPDDVRKSGLDSKAMAIVKSVRKSMNLGISPSVAPNLETDTSLGSTERKDVDVSVSSDSSKKRDSLESVDFGKFVTLRKSRRTQNVDIDNDGFKIPDSTNSSIPPQNQIVLNESGSTEKLDESNRTSTSSTNCQMSVLELSKGSSKKQSLNSVEMSPLYLEKSSTSFSPFEKLVNDDAVSNLIKTLDKSDVSNTQIKNDSEDNSKSAQNTSGDFNKNDEKITTKTSLNESKADTNHRNTLCELSNCLDDKDFGDNERDSNEELNVASKIGAKNTPKKKLKILDEGDKASVSFSGVISAKGKENLMTRRRSMRIIQKELLTSDESFMSSGVIDDSLMTSDSSMEVKSNNSESRQMSEAVVDSSECNVSNENPEKDESVNLAENIGKVLSGLDIQGTVSRGRGRRKTLMESKELSEADLQKNNKTVRERRKTTIFGCLIEDSPLSESNNSSSLNISNNFVTGRGRGRRKTISSKSIKKQNSLVESRKSILKNSSSDISKDTFYSLEDTNAIEDNCDLKKVKDVETNEVEKERDVNESVEKDDSSTSGNPQNQNEEDKSSLLQLQNSLGKSSGSDFESVVINKKPCVDNKTKKSLIENNASNKRDDLIANKQKNAENKIINEDQSINPADASSNGSNNTTSDCGLNSNRLNNSDKESSKITSSSDGTRNTTIESTTSAKDTGSVESKLTADASKHSTSSSEIIRNITSDSNTSAKDTTSGESKSVSDESSLRSEQHHQQETNAETEDVINKRPDNAKPGVSRKGKNVNLNKKDCPEDENLTPKKGRRKLYNPNTAVTFLPEYDVDKEREERAKKNELNSSPAIILTARTKQFMDENLNAELSASENEDEEEDDEQILNEILAAVKKTPKNKKKVKKDVEINPDLDEQKDLIKEFVEKKNVPKKKQPQRESDLILPIQRITRRSTMDFMPVQSLTQMSQKRKLKATKQPSIVCTRFHRDQVVEFRRIVKKLGTFLVQTDVSERTTHLVAAEPIRTINIVRGIARGIWLLKKEWLHDSEKAGKWLPEEDYELTDFSPAVQQCRIERQTFGSLYSMDIFENCGPIHVFKSTSPKHTDLEELIKLAKGTTTEKPANASIIVGKFVNNKDVVCVSFNWVLDSVSENDRKGFEKYLL